MCSQYHAKNECANGTVCKDGEPCKGLLFDSDVQGFTAWFRYEVETRLMRLPDLGYEDSADKIKVAIITCAFNNPDIIGLLR